MYWPDREGLLIFMEPAVVVMLLTCTCIAGLEKWTNANRSDSTVNDRLFPVKLTEIADWKSMSEYM